MGKLTHSPVRTRSQNRDGQSPPVATQADGAESASASPGGGPSSAPSSTYVQEEPNNAVTMSQQDFVSLFASLQRTQAEFCQSLLREVRSSAVAEKASREPGSAVGANFVQCQARFSGAPGESVENFLDAVEIYKSAAGVTDENALKGLALLFSHHAGTWWQGVRVHLTTWKDAVDSIKNAFGARRPAFQIYKELFAMTQNGMNTERFVAQARALLAKLPRGDLSEKVELDMVYSLLDVSVRGKVDRDSITNFEALLKKCNSIEDAIMDARPSYRQHWAAGPSGTARPSLFQSSPCRKASASLPRAPPAGAGGVAGGPRMPTAAGTGAPGDALRAPPVLPGASPASTLAQHQTVSQIVKRTYCAYCKKVSEHSISNCPRLRNKNNISQVPVQVLPPSNNNNHIACYGCGAIGVIRTNCSRCKSEEVFYAIDDTTNMLACNNNFVQGCTQADVKVNILNECEQGCTQGNIANDSYIADSSSNINKAYYNINKADIQGEIKLATRCNSALKGECASSSSPVDFSQNDFKRPILDIEILGAKGTALVDTAAKSCIAGHSLYAHLLKQNHPFRAEQRCIKLADGESRLMNVLVTKIHVRILHKMVPTDFVVFPEARNNQSLLGIDFLNRANLVFDFGKSMWFFSENINNKFDLRFEPGSVNQAIHACENQSVTLSQLLVNYSDLFNESGEATDCTEHFIETGDHPPVAVPPYRTTPARAEALQKEIEKMLAEDIIEECESAWSSPALLVPKPNGSFRFCVDYRKLNQITRSDTYPMPKIDELLKRTKRGCVMSTLDLKSGYWQVPINRDRDKTAFSTSTGTYRFKRMPFGLKTAPATFQRLIDRLCSCPKLKNVTLLAYLDDICIISENMSQHIEDLRAVFERLREFKLRMNKEKCVFARDSVKYLGHVISKDGILPDEGKVQAILEMKKPTSLKHLRTFLQTASWFRKFIPGFSKLAEPLSKLTRKNEPWRWETEQTIAFEDLKSRLASPPILIQPDYSKPFVLRTDASNYALGAVLLQGEGAEERPIEYASRLLSSAERNYSTTEREALAVVWAVERFRCYIEGHKVVVGTDHQPLKWLLSLKSPSGRLVRWALKLQAFDLYYQYTPGKVNVIADTLSRPNCDEKSFAACGICSVTVDLPARSPSELRRSQLADPELKKIINDLEGEVEVQGCHWSGRGYLMEQGVLYRFNPDSDSEEPQLVVPVDLREEILKECHDSPLAGHTGVERTYLRIAQRFYFPGMRRIISEYVKTCTSCQRYKASNEKPPGLLQTPVLHQRNEVLAIDLFGPLPPGQNNEKWILLVEDTATRWVELYPLREATAEACARLLIEEYFLRFGLPRRIISDNGVQFISAVMQQCMYILGIKQELLPLYHPQGNPAERKNRDLKVQLAQLVGTDHSSWPTHLPAIRFSMNTARCQSTGATPAYLMFARELRSPLEVTNDPRAVLEKENFVPQITPYLRRFLNSLATIRERVEDQQDQRKVFADRSRRVGDCIEVGDKVLLATHVLSNKSKAVSSKFVPKKDGPYVVTQKVSPTTYRVAPIGDPSKDLGKFHIKELTLYHSRDATPPEPVVPKLTRGRPRRERVSEQDGLVENNLDVVDNQVSDNVLENVVNDNDSVLCKFNNNCNDVIPVFLESANSQLTTLPAHERGRGYHVLEGEDITALNARPRREHRVPARFL